MYQTLSAADQATILRDALRGVETDHLRLSALLEAGAPGADTERVAALERTITSLKKQVDALETKAAKAAKGGK